MMKKALITAFLLLAALFSLLSCEDNGGNGDKSSEDSVTVSSPFEEAPELEDGFETPILP